MCADFSLLAEYSRWTRISRARGDIFLRAITRGKQVLLITAHVRVIAFFAMYFGETLESGEGSGEEGPAAARICVRSKLHWLQDSRFSALNLFRMHFPSLLFFPLFFFSIAARATSI